MVQPFEDTRGVLAKLVQLSTASRLEGVCTKLSRRLVASSEFAQNADAGLVSLGPTELKGVSGPREVFGLDE